MSDNLITFANVSRFYGEVLGVNKVSLAIPPGVTSLVGPNGSGKTTLMNLMTGLIRPSQGEIQVLGISTEDPKHLCRAVGYCAQFDTYPKGLTGYQFIYGFLRVFGMSSRRVRPAHHGRARNRRPHRGAQPSGRRLQQGHAAARRSSRRPPRTIRKSSSSMSRSTASTRWPAPKPSRFSRSGARRAARHRLQPHPP